MTLTLSYNKVDPGILAELRSIVGDKNLLTSTIDLEPYASDSTEHLVYFPEAVVKPRTTDEVSKIMVLAHKNRVPVTARGGGTGLSGGALPVLGGICLSLERMNSILEIDRENLMAVVEPGAVVETLQGEIEKTGLYYPPDPASKGSCFIGGNIAENAGGPHALKYGVTKDYVLGLEAVLADGRVIKTGGKLLKDVAGYNLTQLIVGSEGTLAIVTKIILKLILLPKEKRLLYAPFATLTQAAKALTEVFKRGVIPSACEFMDKTAMETVEKRLMKTFPSRGGAQACLLVELDGRDAALADKDMEAVGEILAEHGASDVLVCDSEAKQKEIWDLRRSIGEAIKQGVYKEEDVVVPRASLPVLVGKFTALSQKYSLSIASYGHAGDGNIHVNIVKGGADEKIWKENVPGMVNDIFREALALGGSISGEHGIGWSQKDYLSMGLGAAEIELMKEIKKVFDPFNILNPGKIFPDY